MDGALKIRSTVCLSSPFLFERLSEQSGTLKRERDLRDEALTRLSLDLEQCQRNEAVLKNEIQIKTNLLDTSRQDYQRQLGNHRIELISS